MAVPAPLIDRDRAERVLEAFGVAALVLADPINVYYATGFWPRTVTMGQAGVSLAIVPRDRTAPVMLVTSQFMHYLYDIEHPADDAPLRIALYTAPDGLEGATPPIFFGAAPEGTPDPFDRLSRESTESLLAAHPAHPDVRRALRAVLGEMAIDGLLGIDSFIPSDLLGTAYDYRTADPLLRRIRMIKTDAEIVLLRHAARNNAQAARMAVMSMAAGGSYEDLRRAFFAETGRRGGIPLFISTDSAPARERDGLIRDGRSFQIDAVSHYAGYHGDYGRTVFVGTPDAGIRRTLDASITANEAVATALRPGLRYSDITRIGQAAVAKAGYDVRIICSPHSVGLYHTDEAFKDDATNFGKADHLIEQNMVLSVDCPAMQADASGNVHLEDLWLITETGCEPLNDRDAPFIQI